MTRRYTVLALSLALLAGAGLLLVLNLKPRSDLDFLLPRETSAGLRALSAGLRNGPASRLLLIALSDAQPSELARLSRALVADLSVHPQIAFIQNGARRAARQELASILPFRYHLQPAIAENAFEAAALRRSISDHLSRLAASFLTSGSDLFKADPTGRWRQVLAHFATAAREPPRAHGVWFSGDGTRALLLVRTKAAGFDFTPQKTTLAAVRRSFAKAAGSGGAKLTLSGPGVFAVATEQRMKREMRTLSLAAAAAVVVILLLAFRSPTMLLALSLPVLSGLTVGATAVWLIFGEVHAAALTFGAALIGIAIDYPFHVAVHMPRPPARADALAGVWPSLRLSVLTTLIAFLPIALSSLPGIAQLGVLAASGIAAAGLTTRYLLPHVLAPAPAQSGGPWPGLTRAVGGLSALRLPLAGVVIVALGYCLYQGGNLLEHDVAQLSPIDRDLRRLDRDLRGELNAPDVRRLIVIEAESAEEVLRVSERLLPALDKLVAAKSLGGYDAAVRYLASRRTQAERLAALPSRERLRAALSVASAGLPLKAGAFDAFVDDLARARARGPVGPQELAATALGWRIDPLLYRTGARWSGLITLSGVGASGRLAEIVAEKSSGRAVYIDLKDEYDAIISRHRRQASIWVAVGLAAAILALLVALRRPRTVVRIVGPVAAALVLTIAAVSLAGGKISIFHLLALLLVVGLGLDYAIFFNRMFDGSPTGARTLKALLLCCATSVSVFAILALSSTPVLHGIGLTVAIGAAFDLLCAFVFARDKAMGTVQPAH